MNYYQHHIGDFNNATRHLTRVERSIYRDLLELYYDSEKPLTNDFERLARRCIVEDDDRAAMRDVLNEFFILLDDGYHNTRADKELDAYKRMAEGGKRGAEKRWGKGNDSLPIATPLTPHAKVNANHEPITNNHKPITKDKKAQAPLALLFVLPEWIDKQHWDAWHLHPKRKNLKPEQKQLAVNQLSKWRDAGIDYALALQNSATNNWQGLFEPKVDVTKIAYEPPYSKYMREQAEKMTPSIAAPNPNNPRPKRIDPNEFLRTIEAQNVVRIN